MKGSPCRASREGRAGPVRPELPTRRTSERILRTTTHPASHPAHSDNLTGSILFSGCFPLFLTQTGSTGPSAKSRRNPTTKEPAGSIRQHRDPPGESDSIKPHREKTHRERPGIRRTKPGIRCTKPGIRRTKPGIRRTKPGICRTKKPGTPVHPRLTGRLSPSRYLRLARC